MKAKKNADQARSLKKPNISLKRKIRTYLDRTSLALKILTCLFFIFLFFTQYLDPFKNRVANFFYEHTADVGVKLERIMIEGQKNISTDDIVSTLNADVGTPLLSIALNDVREVLAKNDWAANVILERRLPNTIYIGILERVPIAILQQDRKLYLVDEEAHIIPSRDIEKFAGLLQVVGSDAHLHASTLLHDLSFDAELQKKVVSAVRYGERRWNLMLEQGITAKMPETNFARAYKYLSELNSNSKLFGKNFKVIDLRDSSKYYFEKYTEEKDDKNL